MEMESDYAFEFGEPGSGRVARDLPTRMLELLPLAVQYPIQYTARTLMQLGHEPMPVRRYRWLGQEHIGLPSGVAYARFIYNAEGLRGLYRGFSAKCAEELVKGYVKDAVYPSCARAMGASLAPVPPDEQFTAQHLNQFVNDLAAEVTASCVYTCASFPFYMLNVRMIAQFVGKEDTYPDLVRGMLTLARETDARDFTEALIPFMIREALSAAFWVVARHVVAYLVPVDQDAINARRLRRLRRSQRPRRQVAIRRAVREDVDDDGYLQVEAIEDIMVSESDSSGYDSDDDVQDDLDDFLVSQQGQVILQGMVHMVPSPYTYPFLHCAARMSVMNTGLLAASPQYMPRYGSWQSCLSALYAGGRNLAYMGSRLLSIRNIPESQAKLVFA